ncbi:MAG: PilZ domain-containing protein [Comamonadaceae bacterium]
MKKLADTGPAKHSRSKRIGASMPTCLNGVSGTTRDISASGLFILQDSACQTGSRIDFWVDLETPGGKLKLCCQGEVVRVEKVDHRFGIGVKILDQVIKSVN